MWLTQSSLFPFVQRPLPTCGKLKLMAKVHLLKKCYRRRAFEWTEKCILQVPSGDSNAYPLANFIKLSVEQNYRITKQQHHFSNGFLTTEKTSFLFLMVPNVT